MEMWVISSGIIGTQEFIPRLSNVLQLLLLLHRPGGTSVGRARDSGEEVLGSISAVAAPYWLGRCVSV